MTPMAQRTQDIRIGIIGGTGLGEKLFSGMDPRQVRTHDVDTPFGSPSMPIITGMYEDAPIAFLQRHGEGHVINPARIPARANVYALKAVGCTHLVVSGATGSLREDIAPGDLVICSQLIDRTAGRERTFYERAAVHVEFAEPFCPVMRQWLIDAAEKIDGTRVHRAGTYICMEGPSFSTRAEALLYRQWGADVVGMTALPEARLAREAEMAYVLVALPTDYDCWRPRAGTESSEPPRDSLLAEIIGNLNRATEASISLIKAGLGDISSLRETPSPAHDALRLAIWSDKAKIDPEEVRRLRLLWGHCFES